MSSEKEKKITNNFKIIREFKKKTGNYNIKAEITYARKYENLKELKEATKSFETLMIGNQEDKTAGNLTYKRSFNDLESFWKNFKQEEFNLSDEQKKEIQDMINKKAIKFGGGNTFSFKTKVKD